MGFKAKQIQLTLGAIGITFGLGWPLTPYAANCAYPTDKVSILKQLDTLLPQLAAQDPQSFVNAMRGCAHPGTRGSPPGLEALRSRLVDPAGEHSNVEIGRRIETVSFASSFFRVTYEIHVDKQLRRLMLTYRRLPSGWGINQLVLTASDSP